MIVYRGWAQGSCVSINQITGDEWTRCGRVIDGPLENDGKENTGRRVLGQKDGREW
jgi:hypothetical protein